jgi:acyl-CoA synthetase (AMP-forming)/AMP-acid ligase II
MSDIFLSLDEAQARLLAPGSPFELVEEEVLGERLKVHKQRARSLRELLARSAAHGDAEYLVFDDGRRLSYAEHLRVVASVAAALRDRYGIQKGDRVAVLAANCLEWIITYWATVSLGGTLVGMNGWWTADETRYGLDLAEPKLLIADKRRLARLQGDDPGVPTVVVESEFATLSEFALDAGLPDVPLVEDDPAVLLFTSGTTGRPKGALLSHRNVIAFVMASFFIAARRALTEPRPPRPPGALLAVFPLFHVSGLFGSTTTALAGGQKTVWPTGRFDATRVIQLSKQENITNWAGAATHISRLLDHPDFTTFDSSLLTNVGIGGSASTPELIRRTEERVPHLRGTFGSGYGATESGGLISFANNAMLREEPNCVGPPLPGIEVRISDGAGNELPEGAEGHICARSPMVMLGYWRDPEANAESILPGRWLKTDDIGHLEGDRLYLASRKRDLILRGGENVYPIEVENRLEEHPGVLEVAVFGVDITRSRRTSRSGASSCRATPRARC